MKNIIITTVTFVLIFTAYSCEKTNNKVKDDTETSKMSESDSSAQSTGNDAAIPDPPKSTISDNGSKDDKDFSISPIITDYLTLKNALVADNDKAAATAGKKLLSTLNSVDMKAIPKDKHSKYMEIADDAKEHAEHIEANAGNMEHQREHLSLISEDIKDLITLFGSSQKLYEDHCPMFNDGKGAIWISESKEIKNPYYGSKMLTCGKVQSILGNK